MNHKTISTQSYLPVLKLTRGLSPAHEQTTESIHFGAIAVVDARGKLIASYADPYITTYLRSSAKPFQALPFIERGGDDFYHLTLQEVALTCASHSGTDEHVKVAQSIQAKASVNEGHLLCGMHPPFHEPTAKRMLINNEALTPNRHTCSGKHSGMLAFARMENLPIDDYLAINHPIQEMILNAFADMCNLSIHDVKLSTDGCSAPNFAIPLYNAALGFARLCDPENGNVQPPARMQACRTITKAMTSHPRLVEGEGFFDTQLMEAAEGRLIAKTGAEGYQCVGLLPHNGDNVGLGVAIKISDGDLKGRAAPAVTIEVLKQLQLLSKGDLSKLERFGPTTQISNWRKLVVGEASPVFTLTMYN